MVATKLTTKAWPSLLAQVQAAGWPVPSRVADVLAKAEKVEQLAGQLPKPSPRPNERELAVRMVESGETVAVIRAEDDAEAERDAARRAWHALSSYRSALTGSTLHKALREDGPELLTLAAGVVDELIEQARPHVEQLARFADRGYEHADVLATGTEIEREAMHAVERLEATFQLAVNLWVQTGRNMFANAGDRLAGIRATLNEGGAWKYPERVGVKVLRDSSGIRLVDAVTSPGGFSLARSREELAARLKAGDVAKRNLLSGKAVQVPEVLDVDPSTISDAASRTFAGVDA